MDLERKKNAIQRNAHVFSECLHPCKIPPELEEADYAAPIDIIYKKSMKGRGPCMRAFRSIVIFQGK